jgi:hypothetical protein
MQILPVEDAYPLERALIRSSIRLLRQDSGEILGPLCCRVMAKKSGDCLRGSLGTLLVVNASLQSSALLHRFCKFQINGFIGWVNARCNRIMHSGFAACWRGIHLVMRSMGTG